jgi:hypothetical protein
MNAAGFQEEGGMMVMEEEEEEEEERREVEVKAGPVALRATVALRTLGGGAQAIRKVALTVARG